MTNNHEALQRALAGRYVLERELGRGGMAVVHLARDVRHDRPVALKVLHPDIAQSLGNDRFQREIHVAARLQHPHILTVLDSGEAAGQLWFTMPYVDGESLRERLDRETQLPLEDALRIACEAAQALQYAHDHGVVHRDIKPENLLLTADGNTLVADFGIARALGSAEGERLTQTGTSIGTAAYMSPEQAAGEREVDARSDVYSLGIVLYEMLAGETPFAAATPQATIARRFTETPRPLRNVRETVPEVVDAAVARALARTAADRFPTARAFAEALRVPAYPAGTSGEPIATRAASPRIGLLTLVVGLLIGAGVLFAWSRSSTGESASVAALRAGSVESGAVRIAVLPFENLGDSADDYFADGVTDAVRGKLAAIDGLEVIARSSSEDYRGTTKGAGQIADELGVGYLLTGTVRWVKEADGSSRVQVSPELVAIGDGIARTQWGQPFNAPLTDVFAVQSDIAGRVSGALDIELGASERQQLAERPTANLEAYDAFLQSEAIRAGDPASLRRAIALLERAVALDSTFGIAWAQLAGARGALWAVSLVKPSEEEVRRPLERAMALAPGAPETYRARMVVAGTVERDAAKERAIAEEAVARYPANPELVRNLGLAQAATGDPEPAVATLRRAVALDPRGSHILRPLASVLIALGRWAEAREVLERSLRVAPGDMTATLRLAQTWLAEGNLGRARQAMNSVEPPRGRAELLMFVTLFGDHYWLLDRAQQDTVLGLSVAQFTDDAASRALVFAQIHHARGDTAAARSWGDVAAREFQALDLEEGKDPQVTSLTGLAYSYAGRHAEARRWLDRGIAEMRRHDPAITSYGFELLARSLMMQGRREEALSALEEWAELSGPLAPGVARLHPEFAPLRGNPRFERIALPRSPRGDG